MWLCCCRLPAENRARRRRHDNGEHDDRRLAQRLEQRIRFEQRAIVGHMNTKSLRRHVTLSADEIDEFADGRGGGRHANFAEGIAASRVAYGEDEGW